MNANLQWIRKVMDANGLEAAGPVRVITTEFAADAYSFDTAMPVRKKGETGVPSEIAGRRSSSSRCSSSAPTPGALATAGFTGHMINLPKIRDSLRAWTMTRGYETTGRPFESWTNGVDPGFTRRRPVPGVLAA